MAPAASCPAALGTVMEPVAKHKILNTHFVTGREEKQQPFQVWLGNLSVPMASVWAPGPTGGPQTGGDLERMGELVR